MPLISPKVHVRIRPNDESGEGGHSAKEEERSTKQLHSYTANSISLSDDHNIPQALFIDRVIMFRHFLWCQIMDKLNRG